MGAIAVATSDPNFVYAGMGLGWIRGYVSAISSDPDTASAMATAISFADFTTIT